MYRYTFDEVITNTENLQKCSKKPSITDIKGYYLCDWIDYGIIGWDHNLNSYFVQLDIHTDELPWWIGVSSNEIPTFDLLCKTLNKIFDVEDGFFRFSDIIDKDR